MCSALPESCAICFILLGARAARQAVPTAQVLQWRLPPRLTCAHWLLAPARRRAQNVQGRLVVDVLRHCITAQSLETFSLVDCVHKLLGQTLEVGFLLCRTS